MKQAAENRPIEILGPKSRKRGISTLWQLIGLHFVKRLPNYNALTAAHRAEDTREIFSIAKRAHRLLEGKKALKGGSRFEIPYPDHDSKYRCMTAMGTHVASGSDTHFLHISEAAKMESKSEQDAEALISMINSVPFSNPMTVKVIEATGQGPFGRFAKMCEAAEQGNSTYELVFTNWLEDPDLCDKDDSPLAPGLTTYEKGLVDNLAATNGQLRWRRKKIMNDHPEWIGSGGGIKDGNPPTFGWEFPAYLQECFSTVEGAVYPTFNRQQHVKKVEIEPNWVKYRSIDWGWAGDHPFVVLWMTHNPDAPPCLTIDPDCTHLISELQSYSIDAKTGEPQKVHDHGPDALRYSVVTNKLRGHVHVYREMYLFQANRYGPGAVCRMIHEKSGWIQPPDADHADIGRFMPGDTGEIYAITVADSRNNAGLVDQFTSSWAMPTIPAEKPTAKGTSKGERWDGIAEVTVLLAGDTSFFTTRPDDRRITLLTVYGKRKRGIELSDEEAEVVKSDRFGEAVEDYSRTPMGEAYSLE